MSLDLERLERAARAHMPKLLLVASPNNPDGSMPTDDEVVRLLRLPLVVVLDEAYVEFAGVDRSRISWVPRYENLIVLRSFSKWAGLAGLRVGYGAFPSSILASLWKIKQPYGVSQAASAAAIAALDDLAWSQLRIRRIVQERGRLIRLLGEVPYLRPYPSCANFVLCRVVGRDASELCHFLESEAILIRHYRTPRLKDHVRISVGTPHQTDHLIGVLRRI